jgi:hypothetical protein
MRRIPDTLMTALPAPRAAVALERALLLTFVVHALAMVGMLLCLMPGVPGGTAGGVAERAAYVATRPTLWRLGWLGWQLTAASDLYLSIALLRTTRVPKGPAWFGLIVTLLALLPDQIGQFIWSWTGPAHAAAAIAHGDLMAYEDWEGRLFQAVGGWGAGLYLVASVGWALGLHGAGAWSKALTWLSAGAALLFGIAVTLLCLPRTLWSPTLLAINGALNGMAFVLLLAWFAEAGERVMRQSRPFTPHGRLARWTYPQPGVYGRVVSYFVRGLFEYVPPLTMASDIRDVIYVNYLVDAARLIDLVPPPLQLQRLGADGRYAMFTFLTYRHGHFGPRVFGPLRQLWPSPIQSNWRLYVHDPVSQTDGVYFLTTAITAVPYALAARYLSEGVPMHVPERATIVARPDGGYDVTLAPGPGTAPDARLSLHPTARDAIAALPPPWPEVFPTPEAAMAYCVPQDRALNVQPWHNRVTRQEIRLDIPLDSCRILVGGVDSAAARAIVGDATPFCFHVPGVRFDYDGEWDHPTPVM